MEIKNCVTVILKNNKGETLVVEHTKCKHLFSLPAGTVEESDFGTTKLEKALHTAVREMKEELNLDLDINKLKVVEHKYRYYNRIDGHKVYNEHTFLYSDLISIDDIVNMEPDKQPRLAWVTRDEVMEHPELYTSSTWDLLVNTEEDNM